MQRLHHFALVRSQLVRTCLDSQHFELRHDYDCIVLRCHAIKFAGPVALMARVSNLIEGNATDLVALRGLERSGITGQTVSLPSLEFRQP